MFATSDSPTANFGHPASSANLAQHDRHVDRIKAIIRSSGHPSLPLHLNVAIDAPPPFAHPFTTSNAPLDLHHSVILVVFVFLRNVWATVIPASPFRSPSSALSA